MLMVKQKNRKVLRFSHSIYYHASDDKQKANEMVSLDFFIQEERSHDQDEDITQGFQDRTKTQRNVFEGQDGQKCRREKQAVGSDHIDIEVFGQAVFMGLVGTFLQNDLRDRRNEHRKYKQQDIRPRFIHKSVPPR
jgi:hypothetical protein